MDCPHCGTKMRVTTLARLNDGLVCGKCYLSSTPDVIEALEALKTPAHVLTEAERLLRARGVYEVALTTGTFSTDEQRVYLEVKASVGRGASGDTLADAYAKLVGGRK